MSVKYVEFNISASGFGCVNTNGSINPKTGREGGDDGFKNRIFAKQRNGQMYISSNCIRGYFFEDDARGVMLANQAGFNGGKGEKGELVVTKAEMPKVSQTFASSYLGLIRGYMVVEKGSDSIKRSSPLMMTDWINQKGEPNMNEVMVNHLAIDEDGKKESNSLFYADTWGDTLYNGMGVLSIENLQFIPMDNRLGHQAVRFNQNGKKTNVKDEIDAFIANLVTNIKAIGERAGMSAALCDQISATHGLYVKPDTLFNYPEEGILLNNAAIHALVLETHQRLKKFNIVKSKGFVKTDFVEVNLTADFSDSILSQTLSEADLPDYTCFYLPYEQAAKEA